MLDKILKVKKSSQKIFRIFLEYRISISCFFHLFFKFCDTDIQLMSALFRCYGFVLHKTVHCHLLTFKSAFFNAHLFKSVSVNKLDGNVYPTRQAESAQTDVQQPPVQTEGVVPDTQPSGQSSIAANPEINHAGSGQVQNGQAEETDTAPQVQTEAAQDVQAGAAYETYTVQDGDTVMGICKKYYGSISKFSEVIALNHLEDADQLYVGQEIKLP